MAALTDSQLEFLLNYDYTEFEKIPEKLDGINDNTRLILEELQKDNISTAEFQTFLMTEEVPPVEEITLDPNEEVAPVEEMPVRENVPVAPVGEETMMTVSEPESEVLAVEEETPPDYPKMSYDELVLINKSLIDNQVAIVEHLEQIQLHTGKSAEADTQFSFYMLWILPLLAAIIFFKSVFNPFTRV